ncbi:MAG: polysaccharide biosynthesis protein, partial [Hyphomonadaceae bacterium]|nr:polysaccharide biosynthesis protein [Hyphomonadaceae bacterium]
MIDAPEVRDRTPLRYADAVLAGDWTGVSEAAARLAGSGMVRAFGPGVLEASAQSGNPGVQAVRSLSDAIIGLNAPQIIACHSAPTRIWAMRLLEQANAHRLRVYAPEGWETVRPWSLRDVLRPETAVGVDAATAQRFSGRRVLVTGAGGSIGQALVKQLALCQPEWIGLLDYSEYNLFTIDHALRAAKPEQARSAILCDVRDQAGVQRCFAQERPDIVFHAAALKHVPIVELHASQGVLTNVGGTRNVAAASLLNATALVHAVACKAVSGP